MSAKDLITKNFDIKAEYGDEIVIKCPMPICNDDKGHCYLNTKKEVFHCWKCDSSGSFRTFFQSIGVKGYVNETRFVKKQEEPMEEIKLPEGFYHLYDIYKRKEMRHANYLFDYAVLAICYLYGRDLRLADIRDNKIGIVDTVSTNNDNSFYGMIVIPCYDVYGTLSYWLARKFTPDIGGARYKNPKFPRYNVVWGVDRWLKSDNTTMVICEGFFDAVKDDRCVALLSNRISKEQLGLIDLLDPEEIVIALDKGETKRAMEMAFEFFKHGFNHKKIKIIDWKEEDKEKDFGAIDLVHMCLKIDSSKPLTEFMRREG